MIYGKKRKTLIMNIWKEKQIQKQKKRKTEKNKKRNRRK